MDLHIRQQTLAPKLACPNCGAPRLEARVAGEDIIELAYRACHTTSAEVVLDLPEQGW